MSESNYTVMIGPPGPNFSWGTVQALFALTASRHKVNFVTSGNGFDDFDSVWTAALNASEEGKVTHFAMLHLDIMPLIQDEEPIWLDTLMAELEAGDLDLVSAICPLKDFTGVTSSGIGDPKNPWECWRRITMSELPSLPNTFTAADLGYGPEYPLLHNTGCWAADLRKSVFHQADEEGTCKAFFAFPERVYRHPLTNKWMHGRESEDWFFSRCMHQLGAKTAITKKVRLSHLGKAGFKNWEPWGTNEHDEATAHKWNVPPGPWDGIQGWFDFADVYQERVNAAADGAHFVELGSWLGKSASFMATAIRKSGKRIKFDCIDNWIGGVDGGSNGFAEQASVATLGRDLFAEFQANIEKCGVAELVTPIRCDSSEAALKYADGSLDFVYVDADHSEEGVAKDLRAWWPKVKPGGVLAGHDFNEPGPKKAVEKFTREFGVKVRKAMRSYVMEAAA